MSVSTTSVAVHAWPRGLPQALADLRSPAELTVISVPTALTASRVDAREAVRHALRHTLAAFFDVSAASLTLVSSPGQAVRPLAYDLPIHLAISHMPGLSVAAISARGAIGVDVMALSDQNFPDWAQVARDYLGPHTAAAIKQAPPADQATEFAKEWTALEAGLKCLGLALTEWTPALAVRLGKCCLATLNLPASICGVLAFTPAGHSTTTERLASPYS